MDLLPTTLAAADVPQPENLNLDGLDVFGALKGETTIPERGLVFLRQTVVMGKWKLLGNALIDLENDLKERNTVAKTNPEVMNKIKKVLATVNRSLPPKKSKNRKKQ